jgi:hypothetical protein
MSAFPMACVALLVAAGGDAGAPPPAAEGHRLFIPARSFKVLEQDSGPVNYYSVASENGTDFIHSLYKPPLATVVFASVVPEEARKTVSRVNWRWRVHSLPKDSNDCGPGFSDSGAGVFLTFKSGMKYKILKYVWSTNGTVGSFCQSKRGWFLDRDTILLHVGGPLGTWLPESVDPRADYAKHFDTKLEDVPDFVGIAVMTDGDQSNSVVESDYADFVVHW